MVKKMRRINLNKGKSTIVDDIDFEWLNQWKWRINDRKGYLYAVRCTTIQGRKTTITMSRLISNCPLGMLCDHINGDTLDNRRENLRHCNHSQNGANRVKAKGMWASDFKGVSYQRIRKRWAARIGVNGQWINLGWFKVEKDAAKAYDKAARTYFGRFALTNF